MGKVKILTKVVMSFGLVLFSPFLGQHLYISNIYCVFHTAISPLSSTVCFYTHSEYPFSQHPCACVHTAVSPILQSRKQRRQVKRSSSSPELKFPQVSVLLQTLDPETFLARHVTELFPSPRADPWLHSAVSHDAVPVLWNLTGNESITMFRDIFLQQIPSHVCGPRLMVSLPLLYALGSRPVSYIQRDISERLWIAWNTVWGDLVKKRKANGASESLAHSCWSILQGSVCVITAMIGFLCTSQIRCVNIIRNISLWGTDLQQVLPGILVQREENKLALISFPTCWRKTRHSCTNRRERAAQTPLKEGGTAGR